MAKKTTKRASEEGEVPVTPEVAPQSDAPIDPQPEPSPVPVPEPGPEADAPIEEMSASSLSSELDLYNVPESVTRGNESLGIKVLAITSITGIKKLGGLVYAVANLQDGSTCDLPIEPKNA